MSALWILWKNKKMDGFSAVEVDEEAGGKRVNGDSWVRSLVQAQHRRSKRFVFQNQIIIVVVYVTVTVIIGL